MTEPNTLIERNELLELAISDFNKFCKFSGVNFIKLRVCIDIEKGKTLGQISNNLNIPKSTIRDTAKKCNILKTKNTHKETK